MKLKILVILATIITAGVMVASTATAASNTTKPGWGYGDKNHTHTGPPGQSVHP